jgi:diguanylate cyclase (GGDEF)-like protein
VLTDALNRRGFAERFAGQLDLGRRHGTGAALLVLDLDGFKQLNDTAGHAAGDALLRWVAGTLRGNLQAHDIVGRLGGDEFVVLVEAAGAEETADRLQRALAERTGASFGVALLGLDGDDFDGLYAAADARLYRQKVERRGGRSREFSAPG